jgi:hypothetical protein
MYDPKDLASQPGLGEIPKFVGSFVASSIPSGLQVASSKGRGLPLPATFVALHPLDRGGVKAPSKPTYLNRPTRLNQPSGLHRSMLSPLIALLAADMLPPTLW